MPNARVPAAAGGLPSRRGALAVLAGAGAVLSLPKAARAAPAMTSPDAAVIEAARRAHTLAVLHGRAVNRCGEASSRFEAAKPPHPGAQPSAFEAAFTAGMREASSATAQKLPPDAVAKIGREAVAKARHSAAKGHAAKLAAYEDECERVRKETGLARADRLADHLEWRLYSAAKALAGMRSATPAGTAAKARVLLAIDQGGWQDCSTDFGDALAASIVREAATLGGAA